jgi:hypothetical protein
MFIHSLTSFSFYCWDGGLKQLLDAIRAIQIYQSNNHTKQALVHLAPEQ